MNQEQRIKELEREMIAFLLKQEDKPYLFTEGRAYTNYEIAEEIKNSTRFGNEMVNSAIMLALDLFTRGKKDLSIQNEHLIKGEQVIYVPTEISEISLSVWSQITGWRSTGVYVRQTTLSSYIKELNRVG